MRNSPEVASRLIGMTLLVGGVGGIIVETDLGPWTVHETPGHAPSHVCLFQPERRLLISGDHLLGRISLFFDYGYSPDPVGEFMRSLDVVEALHARLCLPGHGRRNMRVPETTVARRQPRPTVPWVLPGARLLQTAAHPP